MIKLLYLELIINNISVHPTYDKKSGIILDKSTHDIIHELKIKQDGEYYNYELSFNKYVWVDKYQPLTNFYKRVVEGRIYNIYIMINVELVKGNYYYNNVISNKLKIILTNIEINKIIKEKKYYTNPPEIKTFIARRNNKRMQLCNLTYFKLDRANFFDGKNNRIITKDAFQHKYFKYKGGIIETNNVRRLIDEQFKQIYSNDISEDHLLVIAPSNFVNVWGTNVCTITYESIIFMSNAELSFYFDKRINKIILHECHSVLFKTVKQLISKFDCDTIWIINCLPINFYFNSKSNQKRVDINNLTSISDIFMDYSAEESKEWKSEIIKTLTINFNKYYTQTNYNRSLTSDFNNGYKNINIEFSKFEKSVQNCLMEKFHCWKNNLVMQHSGTSSTTSSTDANVSIKKREENKLLSQICEGLFALAFSVVEHDRIPEYYEKMTRVHLDKMNDYKRGCKLEPGPKSRSTKIDAYLKNYERYNSKCVYSLENESQCPICYSEDMVDKCKLICGHTYCLECMINAMAMSNSCPICKEYVTMQKICVIKESIKDYESDLVRYFASLTNTTLIITNINSFCNIKYNLNCDLRVININSENLSDKIKRNDNVEQVLLVGTGMGDGESFNKIIGYFCTLNIQVYKLNITNY